MNELLYDILICYNKKKEIDLILNKVNYNLRVYNKNWTLNDSKNIKKLNEKMRVIDALETYIGILKKRQNKLVYDINILKKRLNINISDDDIEAFYINEINLNKHINNNNNLIISDIENSLREIIHDIISDLDICNKVNNISNEVDIINDIISNVNDEIDNPSITKEIINNIHTEVDIINDIIDNIDYKIIEEKEIIENKKVIKKVLVNINSKKNIINYEEDDYEENINATDEYFIINN